MCTPVCDCVYQHFQSGTWTAWSQRFPQLIGLPVLRFLCGLKWSNGPQTRLWLRAIIFTHRSRLEQPEQRSKEIYEWLDPNLCPHTGIPLCKADIALAGRITLNTTPPPNFVKAIRNVLCQVSTECDFLGHLWSWCASSHYVTHTSGKKLIWGGETRVLVKPSSSGAWATVLLLTLKPSH